jgi:hypothetical protein
VDGKYNEGARKALNYLLYGCSGYEIVQSSKGDVDLADVSPLPLRPAPLRRERVPAHQTRMRSPHWHGCSQAYARASHPPASGGSAGAGVWSG